MLLKLLEELQKKKNILVHDGPNHRVSCCVGFVEERVQVRQKCVTDPQVMFGARHQRRVGTIWGWILWLKAEKKKQVYPVSIVIVD